MVVCVFLFEEMEEEVIVSFFGEEMEDMDFLFGLELVDFLDFW